MPKDFLISIKETESEAAEKIQKAADEADKLKAEARNDHKIKIQAAQKKADEIIKKASADAQAESEKILNEAAESHGGKPVAERLFNKTADKIAERIVDSLVNR